jgi:hypothetical protein
VKLDSNDLERKNAKLKLEECSNILISLRAMIDSFEDCSDLSSCIDVVDNAERSIEVAFRVLSQGTVSSSSAAIEVSINKTKEAETICNNVVNREEKNLIEKTNIKEMLNKERMLLDSCKDTIAFLEIGNVPTIIDALSTADRALIGVDLVIKCEFGLSMLRKEFQLCKQSIEELSNTINKEKTRLDIENKYILKKKQDERLLKQKMIEQERSKAVNDPMERRKMQDQLEAAIHRLQLYWPAVIDVQNSMTAVEASVDMARSKLASGGLASANAAVSSALMKVQSLEQVVMNIEANSSVARSPQPPAQPPMQSSPMNSSDHQTENRASYDQDDNAVEDESDVNILEKNLKEVNERIEKQNKIMSLQYKLIMSSSSSDNEEEVEALKKELEKLQKDE